MINTYSSRSVWFWLDSKTSELLTSIEVCVTPLHLYRIDESLQHAADVMHWAPGTNQFGARKPVAELHLHPR